MRGGGNLCPDRGHRALKCVKVLRSDASSLDHCMCAHDWGQIRHGTEDEDTTASADDAHLRVEMLHSAL